jgi:putative transposase
LIGWHRAGFGLLWRRKSKPGRPPIPIERRRLIKRVAQDKPLWGEERIANELLLMLGVRVATHRQKVRAEACAGQAA